MNAWPAYLIRNLARRRTRTALGLAGIFLTLSLLTAVQVGLESVSTSYVDLVAIQAGKADIVIRSAESDLYNPKPFPPAGVLEQLGGDSRFLGFAPRLLGIIQVQYQGQQHHAVLVATDPELEQRLDLWGVEPRPALGDGACAVSASLAGKLGAKAGSRLNLLDAQTYADLDQDVATVVRRQLLLPQEIKDFVLVPMPAGRKLLGEPERVHQLAGALRDPRAYYDARNLHASVLRLRAVGESLADRLGTPYDIRLPKAEAIVAFENFTSPVRAVFGVFALLSLLIVGLLIYSLFSIAVEERIREYALLRTLGAQRKDVFLLVLGESLWLCFLGVVPGVLAGVLVAKLMVALLSLAMGAGGVIRVEAGWATVVWAICAGSVLAVGSALIPGIQATRRTILDGLDPLRRGQIKPAKNRAYHPALTLVGVVLSAVSVVVFFVLPSAVLSGNPSLIGAVVLCLLLSILVGFTLIVLGLLPAAQQAMAALLAPVVEPAGELAGRNLIRYQRRHTTTALLFTLSVALVIFVASLVAFVSRTALSLVEHSHGADIRIQTFGGAESLVPELSRLEGVVAVSEAKYLRSRSELGTAYDIVASDVVGMKRLWIVPFGVDTNLARVLYTNQVAWAEGDGSAFSRLHSPPAAGAHRPIILSLAVARFLEAKVGDLVDLSFRLGAERKDGRFRVIAICGAMPGFGNFRGRVAAAVGAGVMISAAAFNQMTAAAPADTVLGLYFVRAAPGEAAQKTIAGKVREALDVRFRLTVRSTAEQKQEARVTYWATQILFSLLLAVTVVIAIFSLVASMTSTVLERRREIGILKALGMKTGQLFQLFLLEAGVLTITAGVAGGTVGFVLAWLFVLEATALMEVAAVFTMPYITFAATLALSLFAAAISAYWPARLLLRQRPAEILRG